MSEKKRRPIVKKEIIPTERLTLRPYSPKDKDRLVEFFRDERITATFMVPDYKTIEEYYELADKLVYFSRLEDTTHLEYGIYLDDRMIGCVNDCGHDEDTIEIGYLIDPTYQGHGYATEALRAVLEEAEEMGFQTAIAGFFEENPASRRVMEKAGMHLTDKMDEEEYRGVTHKCLYCAIEL